MTRLAYHRIERGTRNLHHGEIDKIAKIIGFDPKAFLREAGYEAFIDE
jgi:hypothetical protein